MSTFNPPLSETTILNIPFHPGHLQFTATVTTRQLDPPSTIQIWSDIPDNSRPSANQGQQEWSPRSFQFKKNASVATLSIPFQDLIHPSRSQFSFTYRILHPDGQVQWLGEFGRNGTLIVNRYDDRLVLLGDWAANPHGHVFTSKSTIKNPLQVLSLPDKIQWRYWDLSNGAPKLLSPTDGPSHLHTALLIPSQSKSAIIPLAPVLLTSQDVQVTIHPNARSVYITSPSRGGLLSLQTLSPDLLISSITDALPSLISIPDPDVSHALLLANPDRAPARLFVIPLSPDSSASVPSTLSLPLSKIISHVQFLSDRSSSYFSLSKPTRFVPTSADRIQLDLLDFGGAQFSLSPVYGLVKPDGDVRISLLLKHNRIATPTGHSLLTPPPSPPMNPTESETQPLHSPEEKIELSDQLPPVHVLPVDDQISQPIPSALTPGQSTPNPEQLASGQSTPKPRIGGGATPTNPRPVSRSVIRKIIHFVLRILAFYARILAKVILTILARLLFHTPKVETVKLDDGRAEIKPTPLSSAVHTPTLLTPRRQHSGASTPRNGATSSSDQKLPGVVETLEAVATRIVPEDPAKSGEEQPQGDLEGSYVQEPDLDLEKSGHSGEWEVVHRPGIALELSALPSPPASAEWEAPQKTKPIRLTLGGEESVVKGVKFHLDDVELTNVAVEPLTSAGQEGLWTAEIPRPSRDLTILRIS